MYVSFVNAVAAAIVAALVVVCVKTFYEVSITISYWYEPSRRHNLFDFWGIGEKRWEDCAFIARRISP